MVSLRGTLQLKCQHGLGTADPPEDCRRNGIRGDQKGKTGRGLIFLNKLLFRGISLKEPWLLSFFGRASILIFIMRNTSWLSMLISQPLAQNLHPVGTGFLGSTTGPWALRVRILDKDLYGTLPWTPSP